MHAVGGNGISRFGAARFMLACSRVFDFAVKNFALISQFFFKHCGKWRKNFYRYLRIGNLAIMACR